MISLEEKQLQSIKLAKKKIVEGSLTIWNARLEALAEGGYNREIINHIGSAVDDVSLTNICGCPDPDSPKCGCSLDNPIDFDSRINEMGNKINEISAELKAIRNKL